MCAIARSVPAEKVRFRVVVRHHADKSNCRYEWASPCRTDDEYVRKVNPTNRRSRPPARVTRLSRSRPPRPDAPREAARDLAKASVRPTREFHKRAARRAAYFLSDVAQVVPGRGHRSGPIEEICKNRPAGEAARCRARIRSAANMKLPFRTATTSSPSLPRLRCRARLLVSLGDRRLVEQNADCGRNRALSALPSRHDSPTTSPFRLRQSAQTCRASVVGAASRAETPCPFIANVWRGGSLVQVYNIWPLGASDTDLNRRTTAFRPEC